MPIPIRRRHRILPRRRRRRRRLEQVVAGRLPTNFSLVSADGLHARVVRLLHLCGGGGVCCRNLAAAVAIC